MRRFRTTPRLLGAAAAGFVLPLLAACGAGRPDAASPPRSVHVDSAGVDIVLDSTRRSDLPTFATLDSVPTLRLGALDGRAEEQFGTIADLLPLPDGGVAVLDGQAGAIRVFGPDGAFRTTLGAKGDGPGEMQNPIALGALGDDSVEVFDRQSLRITRFGLDGALGSVTTLVPGGRPSGVRASFFTDGRLAGQSRWFADRDAFTPPQPNEYLFGRDSTVVAVYAADGAVADTVAVLPNYETIRLVEMGNGTISIWLWPALFGRIAIYQPHPDGVWAGFNERWALNLYDAGDGHLLRVIRAPGLDRPATDAAAERIRDFTLAKDAEQPQQRRDIQKWFDVSPRPELMPAYDRIVVDDHARLWLRDWSGMDPSRRWWVFARTGELLGAVDVPGERTTLYAVRCGAAWAVTKDELDVSYVARYPVDVPGDTRAAGCAAGAM